MKAFLTFQIFFALASVQFVAACNQSSPPASSRREAGAVQTEAVPSLRFRVVYLDLDGTALGSEGQPRPATVKALEEFRRCGGLVGLASGRSGLEVKPHLVALRPNLPLVLFNGAVTTDPTGQKILRQEALPIEALWKALEALQNESNTRRIYIHFATRSVEGATTTDVRDAMSKLGLPTRQEVPIKVVVTTEPVERDALSARLESMLGGIARSVVSSTTTVEVLPKAANKLRGIRAVLEERRILLDDVVVFGDSPNDKEMLSGIPVSVAMGNCHPAVCNLALFRIGDHDTDAIARVLEQLLMAPGCKALKN